MNQRLLIVGASVRPWISSARRAGFEILALDFFADWDAQYWLQHENPISGQFPGGSIEAIQRYADVLEFQPWQTCEAALIGGGFENQFDLVRRIADRMPVLGPAPDQLERIAQPGELFGHLEEAGFSVPATLSQLSPAHNHLDWLQKSATSSSGLGVHAVDPNQQVPPDSSNLFFQKRMPGESVSAIFVSVSDAEGGNISTRRLGISRQLVGDPTFGAADFRYCGSIGPIRVTPDHAQQIERIGRFLAREYEITGVWGVDFIVNQDAVWPVDVNPRLTASAELLDSLIRNSASSLTGIVDVMVRACAAQTKVNELVAGLDRVGDESGRPLVEGKAVLFNSGQTPVRITPSLFAELQTSFDASFFDATKPGFSIADVPCPAQVIASGNPILTVRVRCHEADEALPMLRRKAAQLFEVLGIAVQAV